MASNRKPQPFVWPLERTVGFSLFVAVFLFYAWKAPSFSVPGRWAGIATAFSGLDPFQPIMRPVWSALVRFLALLPVENLSLAINLTTAFLGAGSCWLIFEIVRRIPFVRSFHRGDQSAVEKFPRLFAGLFAALFAAASLPMIMVSPWGDFVVLDVFMLLVPILPLMLYKQLPSSHYLYLSFFLFGLGMTEYSVMAVLLPGFLLLWTIILWKKRPNVSVVLISVMLMACGIAVLFVYTGIMGASRVAALREMEGSGRILAEFLRIYYLELALSVPKVGWLLILGTNILPFIFVIFRELVEPTDKYTATGVYPFRLVLLLLGIITLFNLPGTPSRIIGPQVLLITPYIIVAIWFGFLLGYYYGILSRFKHHSVRIVYVVFWIGIFLFAATRHAMETRTAHLKPVVAFADEVMKRLENRTYLLTDGGFDDSLLLAARKAGKAVHLIDLSAGNDADKGRYHASLFTTPNLQNMARLGIMPLLQEWLGRDPDVKNHLAFLTPADIVEAHGYAAIPAGVLYNVESSGNLPAPERLLQEHETFWKSITLPDITGVKSTETGWLQMYNYIRWMSRIANDLGVMLENQDADAEAITAYRKALDIWPDNMSTTINLLNHARRTRPDDEVGLKAQLDEQIERNRRFFNIKYLSQVSGRVRDPSAMLEEANMFGLAGQSKLAVARAQQATGMISDDDIITRLSLARLYLQGKRPEESEVIFRKMLQEDTNSSAAISGLMRVATQRRQFDEAEQYLNRLAELGLEPQLVQMESASLNTARGNYDAAKTVLLDLSKQPNVPMEVWYTLGLIAMAQKDEELFDRISPSLEIERHYAPGMLLLGVWAMQSGRFDDARSYLERAAALHPTNIGILERLVLLDYTDRNAKALRERAALLLTLDANHPLGHFGLANVYLAEGKLELAEVSYRRCLELKSFGPAHNDLAWILGEKGDLDEALQHAEMATTLLKNDPNVWDTLAGICLKRGDRGRALKSIETALDLGGWRSPSIMLHAVNIFIVNGKKEKAAKLIATLQDALDSLPKTVAKEVDDLAIRLKNM